ncbi:MAG TPA: MBL fold metallo-hydrolase [Candidatus Limnocylindria bacterium]|nr:MBL fold metallo-hydrolase [Candidatus Limnocylindria bacterium]
MDCCGHEGPGGDARFDFRRVADGVHVAVAAARVIVDRLRDITTRPVRYVVNTHFHWDHWHGNEIYPTAYPGAEIITNQVTREAMVKKGLKRIQDHVRQVPGEIARLRAELAAAATTEQRARVQADLRLAESYLAEVRAMKPALPTMAFERTMTLYRRDREIQLLYLGRAHTEGDVSSPATRSSAGPRSWATATRRTG